MILWTFRNHDGDGERALGAPFPAHIFDFHIDESVVLIPFADAIQILLQLGLIEPTGFIKERNDCFAFRFHLLTQPPVAEMRVALEPDLGYRAFGPFVNGENNPRSPAPLVNWIDTELHVYISEAVRLIHFYDLLARFLQLLFIDRMVESQFDFLAQSLRFNAFSSIDYNLAHDRTRLHLDDHFDAIAFRLGEDTCV